MDLQEILVTGPGNTLAAPQWMSEYPARLVPGTRLARESQMPRVVFVRAHRPSRLLASAEFLRILEGLLRAADRSILVLEFDKAARVSIKSAAEVVRALNPMADIEVAFGAEHARATMAEVQVKLLARWGTQTTSALSQARQVIRTGKQLRGQEGRLSGKAVAAAFGLSVSELASLLGVSRQRLAKTPDAKAVQRLLMPFERIFRLRAVLSEDEFSVWLRQPNAHLDGSTPLECIRRGRAEVVANLAEDMLTGHPS
jgi:Antitoxin Xre/MbcA/ParS C-terminal toxin-binding domain